MLFQMRPGFGEAFAPEWCFLGQSEAPSRVFPCHLSGKILENNDLFAV